MRRVDERLCQARGGDSTAGLRRAVDAQNVTLIDRGYRDAAAEARTRQKPEPNMSLKIRKLAATDAEVISQAFAAIGWNKPAEQYERYHRQQEEARSVVLVAEWQDVFAGYVKIDWRSDYAYFEAEDIPEIQDLNVLPQYRRRGIGSRLLDEAEALVAERRASAGIGVGLHPGYNAAQRMYVLRGYAPDAQGVTWKGRYIQEGQEVVADDDLVLHLVKELRSGS